MNDLQEKLAQTIRSRRHDMGMSQEQLKIDKTPSFFGQMERGECFPKIETLQAFITSLGIDAKKGNLLMEFARLLHKMPL